MLYQYTSLLLDLRALALCCALLPLCACAAPAPEGTGSQGKTQSIAAEPTTPKTEGAAPVRPAPQAEAKPSPQAASPATTAKPAAQATPTAPTPPPAAAPTPQAGRAGVEAQRLFAQTRVMWDINEKCSDPALAMDYLDTIIIMEPEYADAYMRRAMAASELGLWDDAFDDSSRAIRLDPKADNYAYRGLIFMRQGNYMGARKDLEKAQRLMPRNVNAKIFLQQLDEKERK